MARLVGFGLILQNLFSQQVKSPRPTLAKPRMVRTFLPDCYQVHHGNESYFRLQQKEMIWGNAKKTPTKIGFPLNLSEMLKPIHAHKYSKIWLIILDL